MSYEGFREYLCANGHYDCCDANDDIAPVCPQCGAVWAHSHSVDQTNGEIEDDPSTIPAGKELIGIEDDWREDRHGNQNAKDIPRYRPTSSAWGARRSPRERRRQMMGETQWQLVPVEPTEKMILAGVDAWWEARKEIEKWAAEVRERTGGTPSYMSPEFEAMYRAMLAVAPAPPKP